MIRMEDGNVAEYRLTSEEFLNGYQAKFGPIRLREISDICMVSMAVPLAEEQAVQKALKTGFGIDMPDIGQSQCAAPLDSRVLRMGLDQMFVLFPRAQNIGRAEQQIKTLMTSAVYIQIKAIIGLVWKYPDLGAAARLNAFVQLICTPSGSRLTRLRARRWSIWAQ